MSRKDYNYKRHAIKAAKELFYPVEVILMLQAAKTGNEVVRIMKQARER
jgi:hypothetical protein